MTQAGAVPERLIHALNKLSRGLPNWAPVTLEMFNGSTYRLAIQNNHELLPILFEEEWMDAIEAQTGFVGWFSTEADVFYFINGLVQDEPSEGPRLADNGRSRVTRTTSVESFPIDWETLTDPDSNLSLETVPPSP